MGRRGETRKQRAQNKNRYHSKPHQHGVKNMDWELRRCLGVRLPQHEQTVAVGISMFSDDKV
jgi:hypothetical protein